MIHLDIDPRELGKELIPTHRRDPGRSEGDAARSRGGDARAGSTPRRAPAGAGPARRRSGRRDARHREDLASRGPASRRSGRSMTSLPAAIAAGSRRLPQDGGGRRRVDLLAAEASRTHSRADDPQSFSACGRRHRLGPARRDRRASLALPAPAGGRADRRRQRDVHLPGALDCRALSPAASRSVIPNTRRPTASSAAMHAMKDLAAQADRYVGHADLRRSACRLRALAESLGVRAERIEKAGDRPRAWAGSRGAGGRLSRRRARPSFRPRDGAGRPGG